MFICKKNIFLFLLLCVFLISCSRKDNKNLDYNSLDSAGVSVGQWYLYQDFINVHDGNIFVIASNNNSGVFVDVLEGQNKIINLVWDGNPAILNGGAYIGQPTNSFGFYFAFDQVKDLTSSSYNKLKFKLKGTIFSETKLVVSVLGVKMFPEFTQSEIVANENQQIDISTLNFSAVSEIVKFELVSQNSRGLSCGGGNIIIDDIQLVKES